MGSRIVRALGWGGTHPDGAALSDRLYEEERVGEVAEIVNAGLMAAKAAGDGWSASGLYVQARMGEDGRYPHALKDVCFPACRSDASDRPGAVWIVAPPASALKWRRVDDDIDFQAARAGGREPRDEITWLDAPIHPYGPWCWEDASGRRVNDQSGRGEAEDGTRLRMVPPPAVQVVAEALGFPDWRLLRPVVATWWT